MEEHDLNSRLSRLREEFKNRRNKGDDWDCPDIVEQAKEIRAQLRPIQKERAARLVVEVVDTINLGIGGGSHWKGIKEEAFAWVKKDTQFRHTIKVEETELDSKHDDYVVVDFYVDFTEPHCHPTINLPKLLAIIEGHEKVSFGGLHEPVIYLIGNYDRHWHQVRIHLACGRP